MVGKKTTHINEVKKILEKRFTKFDGWQIFNRPRVGKIVPDYLCELEHEGKMYRAIVEIKSEPHISQSDIKKINDSAKSLAGKDIEIFAKIIAVPSTVTIPVTIQKLITTNKIEVLRLKSA